MLSLKKDGFGERRGWHQRHEPVRKCVGEWTSGANERRAKVLPVEVRLRESLWECMK